MTENKDLCKATSQWLMASPESSRALPLRLAAHLTDCAQCQAEQQWLTQLETGLTDAGPAPEGLTASILARLQASAPTPCETFEAWLLSSPETPELPAEMALHAADCPDCQSEQAWLEMFEAAMAAELPAVAPVGLTPAILNRLLAERRTAHPWLRIASAMAALLLISVVLGLSATRLLPQLRYYEQTRSYVSASLVLPELDTSTASYQQRPILPSLDWAPARLPAMTQLSSLGPTWPIALLLTLLWLASNAWFIRRYAPAKVNP